LSLGLDRKKISFRSDTDNIVAFHEAMRMSAERSRTHLSADLSASQAKAPVADTLAPSAGASDSVVEGRLSLTELGETASRQLSHPSVNGPSIAGQPARALSSAAAAAVAAGAGGGRGHAVTPRHAAGPTAGGRMLEPRLQPDTQLPLLSPTAPPGVAGIREGDGQMVEPARAAQAQSPRRVQGPHPPPLPDAHVPMPRTAMPLQPVSPAAPLPARRGNDTEPAVHGRSLSPPAGRRGRAVSPPVREASPQQVPARVGLRSGERISLAGVTAVPARQAVEPPWGATRSEETKSHGEDALAAVRAELELASGRRFDLSGLSFDEAYRYYVGLSRRQSSLWAQLNELGHEMRALTPEGKHTRCGYCSFVVVVADCGCVCVCG
jgi:hypothetical protein